MARWIDLVLCIFPFEADLYNESGLRALFVGHPMIERLQVRKADVERDPNLIGVFPGSRSREVRKILPVSIETARLLLRSKPTLHFEVAAASEELAQEMRKILAINPPLPSTRGEGRVRGETSEDAQVIQITVGRTADIMQRAWVGIVASGSATLEAAYFRMPFALVYKVAWPTYLAARLVVNVNYLGMPNLLAGREVVPEFIQHRAQPDAIANAVRPLIDDEKARNQMISQFDVVIPKLGGSGASEKAARAIIEEIGIGSSAVITP
jgi:lipid-A-disaccharide synthase